MGKTRVMKAPEFKALGKDAFVRKFINKPLEPIAEDVYEHLLSIYKEKYGYFVLDPYFRNLFANLSSFFYVLQYVRQVHGEHYLKDNWSITSEDTQNNIRKGLDEVLAQEISALNYTGDMIFFASINRKDLKPIIDNWNELLSLIPSANTIEYDMEGLITERYLSGLADDIYHIWEEINRLATQAREIYISDIIRHIKESGIKPSNALYRDIYDCLKMSDLLDEEQVQVHDKSYNKYVRENYIKAKYQRL